MQGEKLGSGVGGVRREAERPTAMTIIILQEKDDGERSVKGTVWQRKLGALLLYLS